MNDHREPPAVKWKRARSAYRRMTDEQPFEVFLALLCVIAGIPLLFQGAAPDTVEALLPTFLVRLWGLELTLGAAAILAGLIWGSKPIERVGLALLSAASTAYAIILFYEVGTPSGLVASAITLAFGLACFARYGSLYRTEVIRVDPDAARSEGAS